MSDIAGSLRELASGYVHDHRVRVVVSYVAGLILFALDAALNFGPV
ncbi:hypothetical protein AAG612_01430 [Citromicrobium bathyomarinum]